MCTYELPCSYTYTSVPVGVLFFVGDIARLVHERDVGGYNDCDCDKRAASAIVASMDRSARRHRRSGRSWQVIRRGTLPIKLIVGSILLLARAERSRAIRESDRG